MSPDAANERTQCVRFLRQLSCLESISREWREALAWGARLVAQRERYTTEKKGNP